MPRHTVKQGECLVSIARKHGFSDWRTIYDHAENKEFRKKRPNPNVLSPGDVLFVPKREEKPLKLQSGKAHKLSVNVPKCEIRLKVNGRDGKPLANMKYTMDGVGLHAEGTTSGAGEIAQLVPAATKTALLSIGDWKWDLQLGGLDPIDDPRTKVSGVQGRLANLGFDPGPINGVLGAETEGALRAFEQNHGLKVTGKPEGQTLDKLKEVHGS